MARRKAKKVTKARAFESRARTRITVTLKPLLAGKLSALANSVGLSRSRYLERLVEDVIGDEEIAIKAFTDPVVGKHLATMFSNREALRAMAKLYGEQLSDEQLELFTKRLRKLTGEES